MKLRFPAGLLVNLGEVPKQTYTGKLPSTRMGTAALVRNAFAEAQNYSRKRTTAKDEDKRPPINLKLDALEHALNGQYPVVFSAHRADDLTTGLRLAQEFKLHAILDLATEAYLIPGVISAAKVPVIVHPTMQRVGSSMETFNSHLCNAAVLSERKIPVMIGTAF
jgi:imidazolonepropionase-like amidohydrolase